MDPARALRPVGGGGADPRSHLVPSFHPTTWSYDGRDEHGARRVHGRSRGGRDDRWTCRRTKRSEAVAAALRGVGSDRRGLGGDTSDRADRGGSTAGVGVCRRRWRVALWRRAGRRQPRGVGGADDGDGRDVSAGDARTGGGCRARRACGGAALHGEYHRRRGGSARGGLRVAAGGRHSYDDVRRGVLEPRGRGYGVVARDAPAHECARGRGEDRITWQDLLTPSAGNRWKD